MNPINVLKYTATRIMLINCQYDAVRRWALVREVFMIIPKFLWMIKTKRLNLLDFKGGDFCSNEHPKS